MLKLTVGIIGKISSGKSSIAKALQEATNLPIASFGGYLLHYSKENNLLIDRRSLQDLGERFINDSPKDFFDAVIKYSKPESESIIIEGIRHIAIFEAIKSMSDRVFLAYIDASAETRYKRFCERKKETDTLISFSEFELKNQHPVEAQIDLLKPRCDLIVDTENLPLNDAVNQIIISLQK